MALLLRGQPEPPEETCPPGLRRRQGHAEQCLGTDTSTALHPTIMGTQEGEQKNESKGEIKGKIKKTESLLSPLR